MSDLASLVVRMQADNSQYIKALDQATKKLSQFSKDQEGILKDLAVKFAAAFTVDKIEQFSVQAIESAASMERLSQSSGVAVDELSSLSIAMAGSGLTTEDLGMSFKKLNISISEAAGDPASKAGLAFKLMGIDVHDASGNLKDAGSIQLEIADSFKNTADGANKVALAVAVGGKAYQQMIPTLNQGSVALLAQEQAAKDSGAALSGPAAEAAEAAEKKFATLAATIEGQLANAIRNALVPTLNDVSDALKGATDNSEAFQLAGQGIAFVFRAAVSLFVEAAREVDTLIGWFKEVGGYAAAATQAIQGNMSEAKSIIDDMDAQRAATEKKYSDIQSKLWDDNAQKQIDAAKKGADGADAASKKPQPGNLEGAIKSSEADKQLSKFSAGLREQAAAFGLGAEAAVRYKLQVGPLADALKIAGQTGKQAAADAIAAAKAFQFKVDTKTATELTKSLQEQVDKLDQSDVAAFKYKITTGELGDQLARLAKAGNDVRPALTALNNQMIDDKDNKAVQALNDELDKMNGKLVEAAGHTFDLQNKTLTQNLNARGDQSGLDAVAKARAATEAEAAYQEQVVKGQKIEQDYSTQVASIQLQQSQGQISDADAQQKLNALQLQEISNLQGIYAAEKAISDNAGIDKLTEQTAQFNVQIIDLQKNTNQLEAQLRGKLEDAFADNFADLITGAKGFKAAFTDMIKSIQKDLASMVSKDLSQAIFGQGGPAGGAAGGLASLFGQNSSGTNGFGFLKNIFSGTNGNSSIAPSQNFLAGSTPLAADSVDSTLPALSDLGLFAKGGTLARGNFGIVGENGPELAYSGHKNMHIMPASGGGKSMSIANTFVLQAPGGTITRQSQSQAAAEMARTASTAARRQGG